MQSTAVVAEEVGVGDGRRGAEPRTCGPVVVAVCRVVLTVPARGTMAGIGDEIARIPPVTRAYVGAAVACTALCTLDLVSPYSLYMSWASVVGGGQIWRLLTTFVFFGSKFSIDFIFHMFFLVRYCGSLESSSYRGRRADFATMILFGAILMLVLGPALRLTFLGSSLTFMMVYVWSRRNHMAQMNFLGLFQFTAPYLPWVLLTFSMVLGGNGLVDILGIIVGHVYYFLNDVFPGMTHPPIRLLKTPRFLRLLLQDDLPAPDATAAANDNVHQQ